MRGKYPNNKNIGSPGLFSCKILRRFNDFHARYRVVQNLIFYMIGIYSCSLLTTADLCAQVHAHHARTYSRCVFVKCFASLHFTDNVEDLVSNVAVGLTFKDFLTTFRLVCHVLSTNRSCQTKGPKSKTEQL